MSEEKPTGMRVRILRELTAAQLSVYLGEDTPNDEMCALNDMILAGWLGGASMPHSRGWGFRTIQITRICEPALQALADSKPVARATKTAKQIGIAAWTAIAAVVALLVGVVAIITFIQKQAERRTQQNSQPTQTPAPLATPNASNPSPNQKAKPEPKQSNQREPSTKNP